MALVSNVYKLHHTWWVKNFSKKTLNSKIKIVASRKQVYTYYQTGCLTYLKCIENRVWLSEACIGYQCIVIQSLRLELYCSSKPTGNAHMICVMYVVIAGYKK